MKKLALLMLLVVAGYVAYVLNAPYAGFQNEIFVDFPKGTTAGQMGAKLEQEGVVRSRWAFLLARILHRKPLRAGEYRFHQPASVLEVYDRIARGDVFYLVLTVPEGKNMFDIAAAVERLGVFSAEKFLEAARNPELIQDLDPNAPTLEGYLFPNTYHVTHHTTPERLCRMMTGTFREVWRKLNPAADVHRTVTMASLVEREGKLATERPLIASVFENRLRIGMKLDCDPTTIYAALLEGNFRGTIYRSDLESRNRYNTYQVSGLPPGPIANPGVASIKAALDPAESDYLYFVARPDGSGAHAFSKSLAAHGAAVVQYRRGLQKKATPAPAPRAGKDRASRGR